MPKSKRYAIATLGCRTNQYESQGYRSQLEEMGYLPVEEGGSVDLCVINTCTVTASADRKSRSQIRKMIKKYPGAKVVVTGCLVENEPDLKVKIGGIFDLVPNGEKEQLIERLFPKVAVPEFKVVKYSGQTRAFVKVQDGCNSFCSYCTIPYVRGRSRSRKVTEIVDEIEGLVKQGHREVVLTGINIGDFKDGDLCLSDLIKRVDQVEGLDRLRLSSIDPEDVTDDLIEAIVGGEKTCHSFHLVLQSGSNVVLKRMNRKYTRQGFLSIVDKCRAVDPKFTFTTDAIIGFPGESEADFQETLQVIEEVGFVHVHSFPYSDRPRTRALSYPHKVEKSEMDRRKKNLMRAVEQRAFSLREEFIGEKVNVLCESPDRTNAAIMTGHTDRFLPVRICDETLKSNDLIEVELFANTPQGLLGKKCLS